MLTDFVHSLIDAVAVAIVTISLGSFGVLFKMWLDLRSLRKGQSAVFKKVRGLEAKVFGAVTSELDSRET